MGQFADVRSEVQVRPLELKNLGAADRIFRLAFGTFLGMPDPLQFGGDADFVRSRWRADPKSVLGAELNGDLVGSNFVTNWGSFGFFGPLTVRPDLWDKGIARRLLESTVAMFETWGARHRGLYTFANSPKHVSLYQRFGFWPRNLNAAVQKQVGPDARAAGWSKLSEAATREQEGLIEACREVTGEIFEGLNAEREIRAVIDQKLGEVVLLDQDTKLAGFGVCHCGAGSEAGSGKCYVKFGAIRPGPQADRNFERLLDACCALASERKLATVTAGVHAGRIRAYRQCLNSGFHIQFLGLAMETGTPGSGYNHADVFVLDDWR